MKILHKLLLSLLSMIFIASIAGYIAVHESNKELKKHIGEGAVSLTVQIIGDIDRRIYERIGYFEEFSSSTLFRDMLSKANQDFEKMRDIQGYINEKDHEWTSAPVGALTPFMRKLMDNDLSILLREKINFYNKEHQFKIYGEAFVTNKYGANMAQTGKTSDYRQDDEEWWQSAKRDGFYIRNVAYDESSGVYSTDVALRIDDGRGALLGIMKVVLSIEDSLNNIKIYEASEKYRNFNFKLLTKEGQSIYSTEDDDFLADLSNAPFFKQITAETGYFEAMGDKSGEGHELFVYARSKGFQDYKGLGWILVLKYKVEDIYSPLHKLNRRLEILLAALIVVAVIISYLISKTISRPIETLRAAAIKIGDGKMDTSIEVDSKDEIGDLASVLVKMTGELKRLATTDRLTQTYNRVKFEEVIKIEIERATRYNRALSLSIFDIDHFKRLNDTYGHRVGDDILKAMVTIVKRHIRKTNYLFRWGGEEFVVVLPEADLEGAKIQAERIRKEIEGYKFPVAGTVTVSFGIAQFKEDDSGDTLLAKADAALYQAKSNGRNRIEVSI